MLYPTIASYFNQEKYSEMFSNYNELSYADTYEKQLKLAKEYNKQLMSVNIQDIFINPQIGNSSTYLNLLNINEDGVMGYIEIPKIDVKLPIYHGTSSEVLQKGVGHLEGSSLPVGGKGTHAILSAHRGLPTAKLFTDLNQLQKEDKFYIRILGKILVYEVDQILVVEPNQTDALMIDENKDYITLVTCTPYAVNTHRLLVRGVHVETKDEAAEELILKEEKKASYFSISDIYLSIGIWIIDFVLITAIVMVKKSYSKNLKYEE